eukprot:1370820-Amorphochlora_amoeboformis.AAC.1
MERESERERARAREGEEREMSERARDCRLAREGGMKNKRERGKVEEKSLRVREERGRERERVYPLYNPFELLLRFDSSTFLH